MTYDVDNLLRLVTYFADKADGLDIDARSAKIFDNPVDKGDVREGILWNFLENHLPKRCGVVRGGQIFNQFGNTSKQIDLIVTNDATIQFKQKYGGHETKEFNSIEGSLAAISVKSNLDKQEFIDALDNLASIPTTPRSFAPIAPQEYQGVLEEMLYRTPYKVIFAFRGMSVDTAVEHLEDYIRKKRRDDRIMPDLIIVNKSYYIHKVSLDPVTTSSGEELRTGSYRVVAHSEHIAGLSLMRLVSEIQMVSNFTSLAMIEFNTYELRIQDFLMNKHQGPLVRSINRDRLLDTHEMGSHGDNEEDNSDASQRGREDQRGRK